jgi:hypothetical protein
MILLGVVLDVKIAQRSPLWRLFLFSSIPSLLNSIMNPLIYASKIYEFREAFFKFRRSVLLPQQNASEAPVTQIALIELNERPASEYFSCVNTYVTS